ncbi:MAG: hypothetical protein BJBARM5_0953 [Candidatus Parvarchaeum acidophilus ARMAN-5]|uniref:Uncharacterized protein n=1 Tax=Candidatus Parvarchaeum acidophilus ARMAN-5 TaxID=662762 RepID=D6GWS7_PARA5|nr:MAG: hypothetical protein BJBARM5_0953 [Candidatus Parvarchaeum acidophilus ARMAN-5]
MGPGLIGSIFDGIQRPLLSQFIDGKCLAFANDASSAQKTLVTLSVF